MSFSCSMLSASDDTCTTHCFSKGRLGAAVVAVEVYGVIVQVIGIMQNGEELKHEC